MRSAALVFATAVAAYAFTQRRRKAVPDDVLVVQVRAALEKVLWQPGSVDVQVRRGVVLLHGPVAVSELRRAARAAWTVPGVRGVENRLTVVRPRQPARPMA